MLTSNELENQIKLHRTRDGALDNQHETVDNQKTNMFCLYGWCHVKLILNPHESNTGHLLCIFGFIVQ